MGNVKTHDRVCKAKGIEKEICHETNMYIDKPARFHPGCKHRKFRHHKNDCNSIKEDVFYLSKNKKLTEDVEKSCNTHIDFDNLMAKETNSCGCPTSLEKSKMKFKDIEKVRKLIRSRRQDFLTKSIDCDSIEKYFLKKTKDKDLAREAKDRCTLYKSLINYSGKKPVGCIPKSIPKNSN